MHYNVSMFDVHRVPPMFPELSSASPAFHQGDRSLALVLFIAKVVSFVNGSGKAGVKDGISAETVEADDRTARNEGASC